MHMHSSGIHCCEEKAEPEMGFHSMLRSPKKEEQQVPDTIDTELVDIEDVYADEDINIEGELEGIWGVEDEGNYLARDGDGGLSHQLSWDFMDWGGLANGMGEEEEEEEEDEEEELREELQHHHELNTVVKKENESNGFWDVVDDDDGEKKRVSLNLNLNYQEVLDAWSDRGPLWADEYSLSMAINGHYMGEVPVMEEERTRREASVLRYKEKRQTRLFSKKIRYQVRKLNADKRPRLKGRFVKRGS